MPAFLMANLKLILIFTVIAALIGLSKFRNERSDR